MFLITLAWPFAGRTGRPIWQLILLFAGYNLTVELLRAHHSSLRAYTWIALLDLPMAALVYFYDTDPTGPLFPIFYLAVLSAAASMTVQGTILYTAAVVGAVVLIAPSLPLWSPTPALLRDISARLAVLAVVGIGAAFLTRRLVEQQEVARSSRLEAQQLEERQRIREEFIATISHEFRTPITAAQAGLGMLETSIWRGLAPEEHRLLQTVRQNIERLGSLVDDLLTYNQLEAGLVTLETEPLDLRIVVADAVSAVLPQMRARGQLLAVDLPEPLRVAGDARRLEQVVVNLLANAHRHTPAGTCVTIYGHAAGDEVTLVVRDTGPGIPAEALEAIFERFGRLDGAEEGTGLGLAIARGIVELHGGRIWAESIVQEGSAFHMALPRLKIEGECS